MKKVDSRQESLPEYFLITVISIIYLISGATTVTGEDSGSFHLALTTLGINHPPGYPLYTILGFIFVKIMSPFIEQTHAVNLFSAVWTILSLFVLRKILIKLGFSRIVRLITITLSAFATGLWSQTNVAEVYSMNVFLCMLTLDVYLKLYDSIRYELVEKDGKRKETSSKKKKKNKKLKKEDKVDVFKTSYYFSFLCGVGIAHHYPLFLLTVTPLIVHLWFATPNDYLEKYLLNKKFLICFGFLFLGLLPYLYLLYPLIFPEAQESGYVFGNFYALTDVWNHFKRESYAVVDYQASTLQNKLSYQINMVKLLWVNLKGFVILIPFGLFIALKTNFRKYSALVFSFLGTTFALSAILNFPVNSLYIAVFRVFPLPGIMILSILLAFAIQYFVEEQNKVNKKVILSLLGILLAHQIYSNYALSSRKDYVANLNGAIAYLESLPQNSRLLITGDEGISLYFAHKHLKVRPDLTIIAYENSYTSTKILSRKEYRAAKKDPEVANQLRAKKIIKWATSDRPLVSMVKAAFDTTGIPATELIYGFAANRKGFNFLPPAKFKNNFLNISFIKTLFPPTPRPDHWSDGNTLNYAPPLIAVLSKAGLNSYQVLKNLKRSPIGKIRKDLFKLRNKELEKRVAFKLFSLGETDQAVQILKEIKEEVPYDKLEFEVKYLYCTLLAKQQNINTEKIYCSQVLQEEQQRKLLSGKKK